jgi:hypothetical protein
MRLDVILHDQAIHAQRLLFHRVVHCISYSQVQSDHDSWLSMQEVFDRRDIPGEHHMIILQMRPRYQLRSRSDTSIGGDRTSAKQSRPLLETWLSFQFLSYLNIKMEQFKIYSIWYPKVVFSWYKRTIISGRTVCRGFDRRT